MLPFQPEARTRRVVGGVTTLTRARGRGLRSA
jgi:hypothetical protein